MQCAFSPCFCFGHRYHLELDFNFYIETFTIQVAFLDKLNRRSSFTFLLLNETKSNKNCPNLAKVKDIFQF